jgi:secondary thiamine-phosphate synthase enzyme
MNGGLTLWLCLAKICVRCRTSINNAKLLGHFCQENFCIKNALSLCAILDAINLFLCVPTQAADRTSCSAREQLVRFPYWPICYHAAICAQHPANESNLTAENYSMWLQKEIQLKPRQRGFHLVTQEVLAELPELREVSVGLLHVFIQHTSASLTINENADPTVRQDFESYFNRAVPEDQPYYRHNDEGSDDLPAHLKSSILGSSVSLPIKNGRLNLGTWQGIYLCEHRNHGGSRRLVLTLQGEVR